MYSSDNYEFDILENINQLLENSLTERQKEVIYYRYGFESLDKRKSNPKPTYQKIGDKLGISGVRVKEIEHKVLRKLRHPTKIKFLK